MGEGRVCVWSVLMLIDSEKEAEVPPPLVLSVCLSVCLKLSVLTSSI